MRERANEKFPGHSMRQTNLVHEMPHLLPIARCGHLLQNESDFWRGFHLSNVWYPPRVGHRMHLLGVSVLEGLSRPGHVSLEPEPLFYKQWCGIDDSLMRLLRIVSAQTWPYPAIAKSHRAHPWRRNIPESPRRLRRKDTPTKALANSATYISPPPSKSLLSFSSKAHV